MSGENSWKEFYQSRGLREWAADTECGNGVFLDTLDDGILTDLLESAYHRQLGRGSVRRFPHLPGTPFLREIASWTKGRMRYREDEEYHSHHEHDELYLSALARGQSPICFSRLSETSISPIAATAPINTMTATMRSPSLFMMWVSFMSRHRLDFLFIQFSNDSFAKKTIHGFFSGFHRRQRHYSYPSSEYPYTGCHQSPRDTEILHDIIEAQDILSS